MNALLPLIGRTLLATIFVISGFEKIGGFEQTAGYMATKGLPYVEPLLVLTIYGKRVGRRRQFSCF